MMADDRQSTLAGQRDLRLGCSQVGSNARRYFRRFSALELQQTFFSPPRPATLERLREQAPDGFGFVVKAWQLITHPAGSPGYRRLGARELPGPPEELGLLRASAAVEVALQVTLQAAAAVQADALLFETPAAFAPSTASRARLTAFFERVERAGRLLVWDPRGVWSRGEAARVCADLGLLLCTDPLAPAEERVTVEDELVYYRISGLGRRQAIDEDDLLDLRDRLEGRGGYCIFDTVEMHRDAERYLSLDEPLED
jgi:uncharacterized protein YecE (DUF72 family)